MWQLLKVKLGEEDCSCVTESVGHGADVIYAHVRSFFLGHTEVVRFLLEACKVNPVPRDRYHSVHTYWSI